MGPLTMSAARHAGEGRRPSLRAFASLLLIALASSSCYHGGKRANAFDGNRPDSQTSTLFIELDVRFVSLDGKTFDNIPAEYHFGPNRNYYDNALGSTYDRKIKVLAGTHQVVAGCANNWISIARKQSAADFLKGVTPVDLFKYPGSATNEQVEYTAEGGKSYVLRVRKSASATSDPDGWHVEIVPRIAAVAQPVSRKLADLPNPAGGAPRARWSIEERLKTAPEADRKGLAPSLGVTVQEGPI